MVRRDVLMKPLSARLRQLVRPLEAFFHTEAVGGVVLLVVTAIALIWANSPFGNAYVALFSTPISLGLGRGGLTLPTSLWVDDLVMAAFFLLVGLEIKRELLHGELNSIRKAALPAVAALGGMVVPATLFLLATHGAIGSHGWGVPMATDIAFALGCLRLLGARIPVGLLVLMTALAVLDDLGAILVVALVYSRELSGAWLAVAGLCGAGLIAMNRLSVRRPVWYLLAGIPLWIAVFGSGLHATLAGVFLGFCVPAQGRDRPESESPLARLEQGLHPWVAYGVMPLFALANAGIRIEGLSRATLVSPVALGVLLGLVVGKPVGILGASALAVRVGWARLPANVTWRQMVGFSVLGGIGFTMSLFVASLAFGEGTELHRQAKIAVLLASTFAGAAGLLLLSSAREAESASGT
jgi:Na+:H+ antiporter, NhaA family